MLLLVMEEEEVLLCECGEGDSEGELRVVGVLYRYGKSKEMDVFFINDTATTEIYTG